MTLREAEDARSDLVKKLGIPVVLPLRDDLGELVEVVEKWIGRGGGA